MNKIQQAVNANIFSSRKEIFIGTIAFLAFIFSTLLWWGSLAKLYQGHDENIYILIGLSLVNLVLLNLAVYKLYIRPFSKTVPEPDRKSWMGMQSGLVIVASLVLLLLGICFEIIVGLENAGVLK